MHYTDIYLDNGHFFLPKIKIHLALCIKNWEIQLKMVGGRGITKWKSAQKLESQNPWSHWPDINRSIGSLGLGIVRASRTPFFYWFWLLKTYFSMFRTDWPDFGRVLKTLKARVSLLGRFLFLQCIIVNFNIDPSLFLFVRVSSVSLY